MARKYRDGNCSKCGIWRPHLHRDHILPKWKGGADNETNIQLLCANCHEDKTCEDLKGRKHTEETRAKMRGRVVSPKNRTILSLHNKGKKHTPEARARMSEAQRKRKPTTEETRAKLRGRKHSIETIEKLKGRVFSNQHIENLRIASTGRHFTEESIQKMRESASGRQPITEEQSIQRAERRLARQFIELEKKKAML